MADFSGKRGLVLGVANRRSIAWAIAQKLAEGGATLAFTYQGDRIEENVRELADSVSSPLVTACDVRSDEDVERVFSEVGETFGGELDLLVCPALGVAHRALPADHQGAARHLEVDCREIDPGQLDLDDRLVGTLLAAVVDVDPGHERRDLPALAGAGLVPEVAEQLVHLPAHPGEVSEWIALAGHLHSE